jgi:hypothetical protein
LDLRRCHRAATNTKVQWSKVQQRAAAAASSLQNAAFHRESKEQPMKKQVVAVAVASALAIASGAFGQQASSSKGKEMEAVLLVTKVDSASGVVHAQTRAGQTFAIRPPADVNLSEIQEGSRYRIRYTQAMATAVEPGAQAAAAGATREVERTGPGGKGAVTAKRAGIIESIDPANKQFTLRGTDGSAETFGVGAGVSAESLKQGEAVTVTYVRPVASRMASTPQPITDPAPPP